jgi:hypothetical protein
LAAPLYYLTPPLAAGAAQSPDSQFRPLYIGQTQWLLWLNQWLKGISELPGYPLLNPLQFQPDTEKSWLRLKACLLESSPYSGSIPAGLPQEAPVPSQAVLLFLLLTRLEALQQEQNAAWSRVKKAESGLRRSLDQETETTGQGEENLFAGQGFAENQRLSIWAGALAEAALPALCWLMPLARFQAWEKGWSSEQPVPFLSLPWGEEAKAMLPCLRPPLARLLARMEDEALSPASEDFSREIALISQAWPPVSQADYKLHLYILPAQARQELGLSPQKQMLLAWDECG